MSASALICLAPGSEEMEAVTTIDLMVRGGIKVTTASVASDGNLAITCSRGVKILADAPLVQVADGVFVTARCWLRPCVSSIYPAASSPPFVPPPERFWFHTISSPLAT